MEVRQFYGEENPWQISFEVKEEFCWARIR
jgi:hypothetical protein